MKILSNKCSVLFCSYVNLKTVENIEPQLYVLITKIRTVFHESIKNLKIHM